NGGTLLGLKKLSFYYLIMAKGGIVRTGTHGLLVKQEDMKGHFSISIPVKSDIAPVARFTTCYQKRTSLASLGL
ncbi:alpha-2-macroglobulin, partial [Homo sapiens]